MAKIGEKSEIVPIGEAARFLGVSIQTLRRWAKSGNLRPSYVTPGKHRYYARNDLRQYARDSAVLAKEWAASPVGATPSSEAYCQTSSVFQARLSSLETALRTVPDLRGSERFSLLTAIVGEIGDNAFAHNLGNWPDIPGVYFSYDTNRRQVVVADRGVGVRATLRRVRPSIRDDREALMVAFTERLSGRAPENRGNGLKFVREVVARNAMQLTFQSGDAVVQIRDGSDALHFSSAAVPIRGTWAFIEF